LLVELLSNLSLLEHGSAHLWFAAVKMIELTGKSIMAFNTTPSSGVIESLCVSELFQKGYELLVKQIATLRSGKVVKIYEEVEIDGHVRVRIGDARYDAIRCFACDHDIVRLILLVGVFAWMHFTTKAGQAASRMEALSSW
jgi:hypothetical protein